jgi:hypothetical protein
MRDRGAAVLHGTRCCMKMYQLGTSHIVTQRLRDFAVVTFVCGWETSGNSVEGRVFNYNIPLHICLGLSHTTLHRIVGSNLVQGILHSHWRIYYTLLYYSAQHSTPYIDFLNVALNIHSRYVYTYISYSIGLALRTTAFPDQAYMRSRRGFNELLVVWLHCTIMREVWTISEQSVIIRSFGYNYRSTYTTVSRTARELGWAAIQVILYNTLP